MKLTSSWSQKFTTHPPSVQLGNANSYRKYIKQQTNRHCFIRNCTESNVKNITLFFFFRMKCPITYKKNYLEFATIFKNIAIYCLQVGKLLQQQAYVIEPSYT